MRLRDQLHAEQLRHRGRIHGIRLDLRVADRLELLRVREPEVNPLRHQEIPHPVPHTGALADRLVRALERREVRGDRGAVRGEVGLPHHGAGGIDRVDGEGPLVEIDAGVEQAEGLGEMGGRRISRRRASLGISLRCCCRKSLNAPPLRGVA